jgi:uncharacterized ubiquitin-like protein YukD
MTTKESGRDIFPFQALIKTILNMEDITIKDIYEVLSRNPFLAARNPFPVKPPKGAKFKNASDLSEVRKMSFDLLFSHWVQILNKASLLSHIQRYYMSERMKFLIQEADKKGLFEIKEQENKEEVVQDKQQEQ